MQESEKPLAKGLLSKKKYKSVSVNIWFTGQSVITGKLVYYNKRVHFIKSEDIENIHDFPTEFCKGLESLEEPASSSYRELCYLLVLAAMYILVH